MNGPPSSGQHVSTGSRRGRRRGDDLGDRARAPPLVPTLSSSPPTSRAPHSFAGVGGSSVSARCTSRLISRSGRVPNASSARRAVPNRFVTSGNAAPLHVREQQRRPRRRRSRGGGSRRLPGWRRPARLISTRSRSRRSWSRKDRRSREASSHRSAAGHRHHGSGIPPGPTPGMRSSRRGKRRVCGHGAHAAPAGRGATPTA